MTPQECRTARKQFHISQQLLANEAKVQRHVVGEFELGWRNLRPDQHATIAKALDRLVHQEKRRMRALVAEPAPQQAVSA